MISGNEVGIRERVRLFKFEDVYDLVDPVTGETVGEARERLSTILKFARLIIGKRVLPMEIGIRHAGSAAPVATISKGFTFWRAKVEIRDAGGTVLGVLQAPVLSLFKYFRLLSETGEEIGKVEGNLIGWEFTITGRDGAPLGTVAKKWAGMARELLTSADRYVVRLDGEARTSRPLKTLVIAAAIAIDAVFKEGGSRTAIGELSD